MIQGINKNTNEKSYRELTLDSSSSLKDFSIDRRKYYRKYILNEKIDEKDSQASVIGRVVETLLLEPELFDEKFYMSACASIPTGLGLKFVEALYDFNIESRDEQGNSTRSFKEISKDAYEKSGYKLPYETVIGKFLGSDSEIYYDEICTVRDRGLTVLTPDDVYNAEKIVDSLKISEVTAHIVNLESSVKHTIRNQHQIENFDVDGLSFKGMLDKSIADHFAKTVQIYDLKCTWSVENFYEEYYLYRRAYMQGYIYFKGMLHEVSLPESEIYGYKVLPPKFMVCDSINYYNPLIYEMTEEDLKDAYEGFEHKGRTYPGVKEVIKDLKWALQTNIWNISRENYQANGIIKIKDKKI